MSGAISLLNLSATGRFRDIAVALGYELAVADYVGLSARPVREGEF